MRRMQLMTVASLLTATLAVGWAYAQGDAGRLTAQDYAEIQQLYSRYAQGTDLEDADMWLSVFAEDAVFRIGVSGRSAALPAGEYVGHAELAEWRAQSFAGRDAGRQNRHWNSSWVITPTGDGTAEGRNYWLLARARCKRQRGQDRVDRLLRGSLREDSRRLAYQTATRPPRPAVVEVNQRNEGQPRVSRGNNGSSCNDRERCYCTLIRSISKMSVALGGMTPPDPCSP